MSTLIVKTQRILSVTKHPNADTLDLVQIGGWQCVVKQNQYKEGDLVVYVPPDALITTDMAETLGVTTYLGNIPKNHELHGKYLKVKAARLRGEESYGILFPPSLFGIDEVEDLDCVATLDIIKWEPPPEVEKVIGADNEKDHPQFSKYTDMENINNYPNELDGLEVIITEKGHGQNHRVGYVDSDRIKFRHAELGVDVYHGIYMAGSHNCVKRQFSGWKVQTHWKPLENENVRRLLFEQRALTGKPVVLYSEMLGAGCQDLDYGKQEVEFLCFDIKVGENYIDASEKYEIFKKYNLPHVPILYQGPYSLAKVKELTSGDSVIGKSSGKFKGREGVVVTPIKEEYRRSIGRLIFKSISADYLARKNPTDSH